MNVSGLHKFSPPVSNDVGFITPLYLVIQVQLAFTSKDPVLSLLQLDKTMGALT